MGLVDASSSPMVSWQMSSMPKLASFGSIRGSIGRCQLITSVRSDINLESSAHCFHPYTVATA